MVKLQLKRSGGLLGKTLQASGSYDVDEKEVIEQLKALAPVEDKRVRDELYYSITVNDGEAFYVDATQTKGRLKKIIEELEGKLKAG
ncbi:hypothetical protein [Polluticoccus soli]|uniref:hypothetical protein n=1 Tax=Polluticoccus soli TaxID=3034150 RepID=UPI0023E281CE|nr:hypothetical protein [Flavipsychrobacter sp. JY13-12]